ncbi:expressed unknown protein [Seminavis robusta]|uniref:Uncharacterized protein n=1 Tax=Seminavis robusta TaxID=568900 RepID=A0A9N8H130_9STRA|nr:expressed unknown protein [Seminavis robusta]|eukprot:Sro10_g007920.1 n/a (359) ;mRNA; f:47727-48803
MATLSSTTADFASFGLDASCDKTEITTTDSLDEGKEVNNVHCESVHNKAVELSNDPPTNDTDEGTTGGCGDADDSGSSDTAAAAAAKKLTLSDLPEWLSLVKAYCEEMQKVQDDLCQRMQLNELLFENAETVRKTNLSGWEKLEESRESLIETITQVEQAIAQANAIQEQEHDHFVDPQDLTQALAMLRIEESKVDQEIQKFVKQNEKVLQDMVKIRANNTEIARVLETSWAKSGALTRSLNKLEQDMIEKHANSLESGQEASEITATGCSDKQRDESMDSPNLENPEVQEQYQRAIQQLQQIRSSNAKSSRNLQDLFDRARDVREDALANHAEMESLALNINLRSNDHDAEDETPAE